MRDPFRVIEIRICFVNIAEVFVNYCQKVFAFVGGFAFDPDRYLVFRIARGD